MAKIGMEEGQPIEHSILTRAIENAQKKVEGHNFDIRKHLLEYDDVLNKQREVIYNQRRDVLLIEDIASLIEEMHTEVLQHLFETHIAPDAVVDDWDLAGLADAIFRVYVVRIPLSRADFDGQTREAVFDTLKTTLDAHYAGKQQQIDAEQWQALARWIMLQIIDKHWKDHLLSMDHLKEGIGLRGYGQKNPLNEYKREGFDLFIEMTERIKADVIEYLFKIQIAEAESPPSVAQVPPTPSPAPARYVLQGASGTDTVTEPKTVRRQGAKVGRNAPCPCGSGKKYKRCCGALS